MITLDELAHKYNTDKKSGQHDYCRHYEFLFASLREKPIKLLEIGVMGGNSLRMWRDFFANSQIYGIDIDPHYITLLGKDCVRITGLLGDYTSFRFLQQDVCSAHGPFDIIIDDADHVPQHIQYAYTILWPYVKPGGFYAIEDLQAGFMKMYDPTEKSLYPWIFGEIGYLEQFEYDSIYFAKDLVILKKGKDE